MNTRGMTGKHGGLSVDLLNSRLKGTGLSPSWGNYLVLLCKTPFLVLYERVSDLLNCFTRLIENMKITDEIESSENRIVS